MRCVCHTSFALIVFTDLEAVSASLAPSVAVVSELTNTAVSCNARGAKPLTIQWSLASLSQFDMLYDTLRNGTSEVSLPAQELLTRVQFLPLAEFTNQSLITTNVSRNLSGVLRCQVTSNANLQEEFLFAESFSLLVVLGRYLCLRIWQAI